MICKTCGIEKPTSDYQFIRNKSGGGSYRLECKDCYAIKHRASCADWFQRNRATHMAGTKARREAKKKVQEN